MNVVPSSQITTVKILKGVPLDSSYTDTMDFINSSAQESFFNSKVKYTYDNMTPIRLQNTIRIPAPADHLYDCNYVMFKNSAFSFKWFYAFITKINYENTNMSTVEIELDVWQCWMFDITIKRSYVLREHASSNNIGTNLVAESIDLGDYVSEYLTQTPYFNNYSAVIATAYDPEKTPGGIVGGLFTGIEYIAASIDDASQVDVLIKYLASAVESNVVDSIVSLFTMPSDFFTYDETANAYDYEVTKRNTSIGQYTPRNKKLLSYPYNMLYAYSCDGESAVFRYEYFSTDKATFRLECGMSCNPEIVMIPKNYDNSFLNIDESLTMTGFPQIAYSIDSFRAYLSQNASSVALSTIGGVGLAVGGAMTGNLTAVAGGVYGLANSINSTVLQSVKPPQARGTQGGSTFVATKQKNFYFANKHITPEYAMCIDDYFDKYGYSTNRVKIPNTKGRPSWNYVHIKDSIVVGNVPFDDLTKLKATLNNGITFWHGDWVGDYNRNNQP